MIEIDLKVTWPGKTYEPDGWTLTINDKVVDTDWTTISTFGSGTTISEYGIFTDGTGSIYVRKSA